MEAALDAFGPERLMFGGDWPMSLNRAPYPLLVAVVRDALAGLTAGERAAVLHETARRVYRLGPAAPEASA